MASPPAASGPSGQQRKPEPTTSTTSAAPLEDFNDDNNNDDTDALLPPPSQDIGEYHPKKFLFMFDRNEDDEDDDEMLLEDSAFDPLSSSESDDDGEHTRTSPSPARLASFEETNRDGTIPVRSSSFEAASSAGSDADAIPHPSLSQQHEEPSVPRAPRRRITWLMPDGTVSPQPQPLPKSEAVKHEEADDAALLPFSDLKDAAIELPVLVTSSPVDVERSTLHGRALWYVENLRRHNFMNRKKAEMEAVAKLKANAAAAASSPGASLMRPSSRIFAPENFRRRRPVLVVQKEFCNTPEKALANKWARKAKPKQVKSELVAFLATKREEREIKLKKEEEEEQAKSASATASSTSTIPSWQEIEAELEAEEIQSPRLSREERAKALVPPTRPAKVIDFLQLTGPLTCDGFIGSLPAGKEPVVVDWYKRGSGLDEEQL